MTFPREERKPLRDPSSHPQSAYHHILSNPRPAHLVPHLCLLPLLRLVSIDPVESQPPIKESLTPLTIFIHDPLDEKVTTSKRRGFRGHQPFLRVRSRYKDFIVQTNKTPLQVLYDYDTVQPFVTQISWLCHPRQQRCRTPPESRRGLRVQSDGTSGEEKEMWRGDL